MTCHCCYVSCHVTQECEMEEVEIGRCSRGEYFGELALVTKKPRAASVYAVGNVKCLGAVLLHL